jgi:hypothetical protein
MRSHLAGLVLLASAACGAPTSENHGLAVEHLSELTLRTDRNLYEATFSGGEGTYRTYAFTVVARLTNGTDQALYLSRCYPDTSYPIYAVAATNAGVEAGYNPVWACVGHDHPIVLGRGETRVDSLRIAGPNAWDGYTNQPFGALTGAFRLGYSIAACPDAYGCGAMPVSVQSNDFEVRLKPVGE